MSEFESEGSIADPSALIASVFAACARLSEQLGRPISPDGHFVGGLGEVFARDELDLILTSPSVKSIDAHDAEGRSRRPREVRSL